jgi:replicative DNA helicase
LQEYTEWASAFNLRSSEFVDVIETFGIRFKANRQKHNADNKMLPIVRFYIDELDAMNNGRDLRTQLSCFMAPTGVGKSHAARWIGKNACQIDGLNVLHFQLEGSKDEVVNAYSASLVSCSTYRYETGTIRDVDIEKMETMLEAVSGKLYVKSYPKFNANVSTIDIRNGIQDFKKRYNINPDVVIIDSIDLLTDSSGRKYGENGERHKRIAVANDLKDLAADENVWMVGTYQSTIENRDWLNDEKNVLTEFNTAEAKGLARPMTHLITLNQSDRERKEHTMRLNVAKSRFFEKGEPFRIATDYENEQFYDRARTMNINRVG